MISSRWREAVRRANALRAWPAKEWVALAALSAIAVAAIVHARSYAGATIDDAFITFRHSLNLIHGDGLSCNAGERIEGTSSSMFALLMAFPIALGADPYGAASLLGTIAFAACAVAAYGAVRACVDDEAGAVLALLAAVLVASSSRMAFHSQTGMETLLYAAAVAVSLALQLQAASSPPAAPHWASVFGVAAVLRPEGALFFLLAFAIGAVFRGRAPGALALAKQELLRFAVVFVPWLLFRLVYFGRWLPNPVLAKGGHLGGLLQGSAHDVVERFVHGPGALLLKGYVHAHPLASALLVGTVLLKQTRQAGVTAFAFALGCAALAAWSGGDWMPYDRLLISAVVPLAVGAALGLRGLFFHAEQRTRFGHLPSYVLSAGALCSMVPSAQRRLDIESVRFVSIPRLRGMGQRLAPLSRKDDVVATEVAGILPYYWGARTLDMLGLCDEHIARSGTPEPSGSGRVDVAYVAAQRPTFYAFNIVPEAARFYSRPEFAPFRAEYALLQFPYRYLQPLKELPITVFVRKDRKDLDSLVSAVGGRLIDPEAELRRLGHLR